MWTTRTANFYWLVIWGILLFGVPETIALVTKNYKWTLSETIWRLFDVLPGQTIWQWKFAHLLLACLMAWLFFHFVFALFR